MPVDPDQIHITFIDLNNNRVETMPLDYCNRECHDITDGYHPSKWMTVFDAEPLEEAQRIASMINASLRWELRFEGSSLFIVPTFFRYPEDTDDRYRSRAAYYGSRVEGMLFEAYETFNAAAKAREILTS